MSVGEAVKVLKGARKKSYAWEKGRRLQRRWEMSRTNLGTECSFEVLPIISVIPDFQ